MHNPPRHTQPASPPALVSLQIMSKYITERPFYRSQILDNASVLYPEHGAKLITTKNPSNNKRKTLLISSKTGEVLLEEENAGENSFWEIYGQTELLLFEKVNKGRYVASMDKREVEARGMRDNFEGIEARLAEETKRREALELRVAMLEQQRGDEIEVRLALLEARGQGTGSPSALAEDETGWQL